MGQALLFGAVASSALIVGAAVGSQWSLPEVLYAALLGFAGGALTSALAFELFQEADRRGGATRASIGLAAGAATFIVLDAVVLTRMRGSTVSLALLAAVTLDGVPENLALGVSLVGSTSYALLVAIFASNFPEAIGSATLMRGEGRSTAFILGLWTAAGLLLALSVVVGYALLDGASGGTLALLLGFAGGAVLASLATAVLPEAFEHGGPWVAFATVAGFLLSYAVAG